MPADPFCSGDVIEERLPTEHGRLDRVARRGSLACELDHGEHRAGVERRRDRRGGDLPVLVRSRLEHAPSHDVAVRELGVQVGERRVGHRCREGVALPRQEERRRALPHLIRAIRQPVRRYARDREDREGERRASDPRARAPRTSAEPDHRGLGPRVDRSSALTRAPSIDVSRESSQCLQSASHASRIASFRRREKHEWVVLPHPIETFGWFSAASVPLILGLDSRRDRDAIRRDGLTARRRVAS